MTVIIRALVKLCASPLLYRLGIAKIISLFIRIFFSCQISPGVTVGQRLILAYGGLGIVIHGESIIGDDVSIGAHVTLGGNLGKGGVPQIGNRVFIGPGAKILGPIKIGEDSIIGANSVVTKDVPSGSVVAGIPAKTLNAQAD